MAATNARRRHPTARPKPMVADRFVRVGRASRQVAALPPDEAGKSQLIEADQRPSALPRGRSEGLHAVALAGIRAPSAAAICPSASTTASNVSIVEACLALKSLTGSNAAKAAHFPCGGGPPAFSIASIVARNSTSSSGVAPTMPRAISDDEA